MTFSTVTVDASGRIALPEGFAGATVVVERISDRELRIHFAEDDQEQFVETSQIILTDRDRDLFLEALENPKPANDALKAAAARYKARHGE